MTKRQAENYARLRAIMLDSYGIASHDFEHLLRIEKALHRWGERECNGEVEVDDDGKAWRTHSDVLVKPYPIANRERGALKRLAKIMANYPKLAAYHQGDPRGCALYVYQREKMGNRDPSGCYSSVGVALCY